MKIIRHGIVERPSNLPHISGAVVHGDTVYLQGVTPDPGGDITTQTRQVLERIDACSRWRAPTNRNCSRHRYGCLTCGFSKLTMWRGMRG